MPRKLFKRITNKIAEPLSYMVTDRAKSERSSRFANKVTEDIKVMRQVRQSDRKSNSKTQADYSRKSLSNPDSLARRKMRIDEYKRKNILRRRK